MTIRNRAEGWKHAKLSGHKNEELVRLRLLEDSDFARGFADRLKKPAIRSVSVGGIRESSVDCILGGRTKSKTDLIVEWSDETSSRVSIKKSGCGQVFLITTNRFIRGYEHHYGKIPEIVKRGLQLFFGDADDLDTILELPQCANVVTEKIRKYQDRKHRMVHKTLEAYNKAISDELLEWFKNSISNITEFCFSRGLVSDKENWAESIWYMNLLNENSYDRIVSIEQLCRLCKEQSEHSIFYGVQGGGTTIQLPFGFLQWHQGSMQFHHNIGKISAIMRK